MARSRTPRSRVAVVTGGASGIGEATCHHLAERGHRIAVLDLDTAGVERVVKELRANGARALGLTADVTDRGALDAAFAETRAALGPTEILVTSAGLVAFEEFDQITLEHWDRVLAVNLTGTFHCCQAALPDMVAARWGRIVTISSSSAQRGSPKMAHYAAAKGGVMVLTKSLARAYASHGITANCIPPSGIETPMQHRDQAAGHLPPNEVMARTIPLGHLGTPDDIAAAAAFLASEEAGFITGQVLGVNGGQVL
ncbi:SDR family oxidoreductase [Frankia sp. CNm7]|uniref:SDR family oxidoreductase n=1 Tax=Frankia nepalensis TaxID=1836974 RepID=A0A937RNV5_9ACTN|nr:SDR family NAD(P)-dependent oxidoreductase [Frankia nepalensis]MBL7498443.1 SDR family oxidoreductase [Frankia nepalensis]MBL7509466.1 SDR family oxidoreductase [Frankia nepalensis]MBL7520168.1 SDR family oxidoreductase [Frankia nepalensis]MBL7629276.1 SDR family oxidoreductase [Frankia nepalensis]